ncbi:MAG TPA: hypothetical protein DCQ90_05000 [Erysipelotrichaceae bacterium]|nr:hypothetical protein [Erysipelotrichaceae bacterium]
MIAIRRVLSMVEKYPKAIALTCNHQHTTYEELGRQIHSAALFLRKEGIKENHRVALILPNLPQFPVFFYACESIGAIAVMIHPLTIGSKMKLLCDQSRIDLAVMTDILYPKYRQALKGRRVVLVDGKDALPKSIRSLHFLLPSILTIGTLRYRYQESQGSIEVAQDPQPFILFSSGTQGLNKGIRLRHDTLDALCDQLTRIIDPVPTQDSMFAILPFFHGFGLGISMHTVLALGGRCILIPRLARNTIVPEFLKEKPTYIAAVPQLLRLFLKDPRMHTADLSFVKNVFCGGEATPKKLIEEFNELLRNGHSQAVVQVGYGCTETLTAVCVSDGMADGCGKAFAGNEIIVVDEHGNRCADEQAGEILIHGPILMDGYDGLRDADPFVSMDGKRYFRSADIGKIDANGNLVVLYRRDHLLKINGYFVDPHEIEDAVLSLPDIKEAIALQDEEGRLCLIVSVKQHKRQEDIKKEITGPLETLDRWYRPKRILLIHEFPKNEMKKTDRNALKRLINSRPNGLLAEWSL